MSCVLGCEVSRTSQKVVPPREVSTGKLCSFHCKGRLWNAILLAERGRCLRVGRHISTDASIWWRLRQPPTSTYPSCLVTTWSSAPHRSGVVLDERSPSCSDLDCSSSSGIDFALEFDHRLVAIGGPRISESRSCDAGVGRRRLYEEERSEDPYASVTLSPLSHLISRGMTGM